MHAVEITQFGAPEVLVLGERPTPVPGAGEVLIKVAASGVNRPDVLQRTGSYPMPPGITDIPGLEVAGVITAVGEGVSAELLGRAVCALVAGGGYAQYCVAPVGQCLPVPQGFSMVEAAALPETFFTVWHNVFQRGGLQAGETLLVQGGSSGIGTTAIQLAKARGAAVLVTAGSDEKCAACVALGATLAVNYNTTDFVAAYQASTLNTHNINPVNVVLDMVAGSYVARECELLADDGRLVIIAVQGGVKAELNAGLVMRKRLTVTGSTLRPRSVAFKSQIASELEAEVWPLLAAGQCKPPIYKVFAARDAALAHALMESSQHIGKIVLDWTL
jgi:NADPH:quinone reductase